MKAEDVVTLVGYLEDHGISVWLDGAGASMLSWRGKRGHTTTST
jgi:hypothetical protein